MHKIMTAIWWLQVVSFFGDDERVDFMRKMMQSLQQKILPAATHDDAPPPPAGEAGAWHVPVGRDEALTVRVGDLDDCVLATHVLWKQGPVCEHMVACVALEFVVQLAAAVRAQGGLWLVGDWYLMPNGSLMTDLSEAPAWCAC